MKSTHGGKRKGAGAKKGSRWPSTINRLAALARFRERINAELDPLIDAHLKAAKGVTHMMGRDRHGKFHKITDPVVMGRTLDSGETFYELTALNPDVGALKELWDRMFDKAPQGVEVSGPGGQPMRIHWQD